MAGPSIRRSSGRAGAAVICILLAGSVRAQTGPSATFEASATIVAGCRVDGATGAIGALDFGSHPALSNGTVSAQLVADTAVTVRCTPGTDLTLSLNRGQHGDGSRRMRQAGGASGIAYDLFADAAFARPLGIDQPLALRAGGNGVIALPIFGRARLAGNLPAGRYADTVLVTLNW